MSHGQPWLGFETSQGRALYLNFEIQDWSWQRRVEAVARAKGMTIEPGRLTICNLRGRAAHYESLLPKLKASARRDFALIILDPIYKLYGQTDENKAGDVARLLNAIEDMAVETGGRCGLRGALLEGEPSEQGGHRPHKRQRSLCP